MWTDSRILFTLKVERNSDTCDNTVEPWGHYAKRNKPLRSSQEADLQKTKITASGPITSWQIDGETVETVSDFIFGGVPKSLQMVTAAMKLKDSYSLEEKSWPT